MTIQEARKDLPDFEHFKSWACNCCTANDWYCPSDCETLVKAWYMDFDRILMSYARNDGDPGKVFRFINYAKV